MRPKKRFGQNFLTNTNAVRRIIDALEPGPESRVLEIGPGKGALTAGLLERAGLVRAVEADRDCICLLKEKFKDASNLEVIEQDFLKTDLAVFKDAPKWDAVGNLPYCAASPILLHVLSAMDCFRSAVFMFQREVAQRITAQSDSKDFGFLSLAVQTAAEPRILFHLNPGSFFPKPKVHSTVVKFLPRPVFADNKKRMDFLKWIDNFFRYRRKMLVPRIKPDIPDAESVFNRLKIPLNVRPENVSIEQWIDLFSQLRS